MKKIINKLGIQNFILIMFIVLIIIVSGLYQTFSLYTSSDGVSIIDSIKTFKFILNNNTTLNSVTIAGNASKNIAITISNDEDIKLKYGIYYSSSNNLDNVEIGYKHDSDYLPTGLIDKSSDYIVTIKIENNTSSNITIDFGIIYGLENGGDLELDSNKYFIENMASYPLSEVAVGSYIAYTGNNGCEGNSCQGYNANYVSDDDMGYCYSSEYKFNVNGWRVMAKEDNNVYLISAGATDCMCTNSDGTTSSDSCSSALTDNGYVHTNNANMISYKYCNLVYSANAECNTGAMGGGDFKKITNNNTLNNCYNSSSELCGANNTLIDNGGLYWYNKLYDTATFFRWSPRTFEVLNNSSDYPLGVRPIVKLDKNIVVTSGNGTYENPYTIRNQSAIYDLSGNMNDGVSIEGIGDYTNGVITTNSQSSYINCGLVNHDFGSNASFALRVKLNEITSKEEYFLLGNWEAAGFGISLYNQKVIFSINTVQNGYTSFATDYTINSNEWYIIVGTFDGNNLNVYINGEKITWNSNNVAPTWSVNNNVNNGTIKPSKVAVTINTNLDLNKKETDRGNAYASYSQVLIFERTLTEEEISTNYKDNINVSNKDNLILYYDFSKINYLKNPNFYIEKNINVSKNLIVTSDKLKEINSFPSDITITDITIKNSSNEVVSPTLDNYDVYEVTYKINNKEVTQNIIPVPNNDISLTNILPNPGFEEEVTDYYNSIIYRSSSVKRSGNYSMYVNSANSQQFARVKYGNLGTNNKKAYVRFYTMAENAGLTPGIYVYEMQTNSDWAAGESRNIIWVDVRIGWTFASALTSPVSTDYSYFMIQYAQGNGLASGKSYFDDMLVFTLEEDVWDTFPTKAWLDKMIPDFTGTKTFNFNT